jgi:type II secretory pathway component PulJ
VVFVVLLFATDRWQRLVPTSWDVLPNALSVLIQYLSLNWPVENGWVAYNAPRHLPLAAVSVLETHANTPCLGGMLPRRLR